MVPHTGPNTSDSMPSSSYFGPLFEPTLEPYPYTDDFLYPHDSYRPHALFRVQHLEQEVAHLRNLNAELEGEVVMREEEINDLHVWIERTKRLHGQNCAQDSTPQIPRSEPISAPSNSNNSNAPTKHERNHSHNSTKAQANTSQDHDLGFRQIHIELALLSLQAQIRGLAAQMAALQQRIALLGEDFSEYDGGDADGEWYLVEEEGSRGVMGSASQDEDTDTRCDEYQGCRSGHGDAEHGPGEVRVVEVDRENIYALERQILGLDEQVQRLMNSSSSAQHGETQSSPLQPPSIPPSPQAKPSPADPSPLLRGRSSHFSLPTPLPPPYFPNSSHNNPTTHASPSHDTNPPQPQPLPPNSTESCIHPATVLQIHNTFLEHEVQDYKDMCASLTGDVRWHMGTQVELEELCEELEGQRDELLREVAGLKRRFRGCDYEAAGQGVGEDDRVEAIVEPTRPTNIDGYQQTNIPSCISHSLAPEGSSSSNIPGTAFIHPQTQSYIPFFPTTPPPILHFSCPPSLPLIHAALHHRANIPFRARACEIRDQREAMRICLPGGDEYEYGDSFSDMSSELHPETRRFESICCGCLDCTGEAQGQQLDGLDIHDHAVQVSPSTLAASHSPDEEHSSPDRAISPSSSPDLSNVIPTLSSPPSETPTPNPPFPPHVPKHNNTQQTTPTREEDRPYHAKGRGCEEWTSNLDPQRQQCTFCHLTFSSPEVWGRCGWGERTGHEDDAPVPMRYIAVPAPEWA